MNADAGLPHAVARIKDGSPPDRVIAELVGMGASKETARQIVDRVVAMQREAQARDFAIRLLKQGEPAAEVWNALVASGVDGAAAEALLKELIELRREAGEAAEAAEAAEAEAARQYYAPQEEPSWFCESCLADSTQHSSGNLSTTNGTGQTFYGAAERCSSCSSVVRVLWLVFMYFPCIPLGAYRVQSVTGSQFVSRQTRIRMAMVLSHWAVGLALVGVLVAIAGATSRR